MNAIAGQETTVTDLRILMRGWATGLEEKRGDYLTRLRPHWVQGRVRTLDWPNILQGELANKSALYRWANFHMCRFTATRQFIMNFYLSGSQIHQCRTIPRATSLPDGRASTALFAKGEGTQFRSHTAGAFTPSGKSAQTFAPHSLHWHVYPRCQKNFT